MSMGPKPFRSLLEEDNSEYYETRKLDTYAGSDPAHYATGLCCQLWRKHSAASSAGATLRAADLFKLLHFCEREAYTLSIMESSSALQNMVWHLFLKFLWGILPLWVLLMKQLKVCCWLCLILTSARRSCDLCALSNKGRIKNKHIWVLNYARFVDEGWKLDVGRGGVK